MFALALVSVPEVSELVATRAWRATARRRLMTVKRRLRKIRPVRELLSVYGLDREATVAKFATIQDEGRIA